MIIVKNASLKHPAEQWIALAAGEIDEYGNEFTLIELRWNVTALHYQTDYSKTKGDIEDTIITANQRSGGVAVRYRQNGCIVWERKDNIGPYTGFIARTPKNVLFLAHHYGDKLWRIVGPVSVENEVKGLYEAIREKMTDEQRLNDDARIKMLHTHQLAMKDEPAIMPNEDKGVDLEEKRRLFEKRQELEQREIALKDREKKVGEAEKNAAKSGAMLTRYSEENLRNKKIWELRRIAKEIGCQSAASDKIPELVEKILAHQGGAVVVNGKIEQEKVVE